MRTHITIGGMSCGHCVGAVRKELEKLENVEIIDIGIGNVELESVDVAHISNDIRAAIERAGYRVIAIK